MNKKSLLTCALVAAGVISQASADNLIYFTGSTAFRSQAFATLKSAAGPTAGGVFDIPGTVVNGNTAPAIQVTAYNASAADGHNGAYMLFHGNINGTGTYVSCGWSGSEAGIANISQHPAPNVLNAQTGTTLAGVQQQYLMPGTPVGINTGSPPPADLTAVGAIQGELSLADTSQASSDPLTQNLPLTPYGQVCAVTFVWCKNNNTASAASAAKTAWSRLTNVSLQQIQNELVVPQTADVFTGVNADSTTMVYPVGRNNGSGTRANFENDMSYGLLTPVNQYGIGTAPDGGVNGIGVAGGALLLNSVTNNGYESGGNVASALGVAGSTSQADPFVNEFTGLHGAGWIAIGYLGISDATTLDATQSTLWLTENGVTESDQAIIGGQYSYWGNENLYGQDNLASTHPEADAFEAIFLPSLQFQVNAAFIGGAGHSVGIPTGDLNCIKVTDASIPAHF